MLVALRCSLQDPPALFIPTITLQCTAALQTLAARSAALSGGRFIFPHDGWTTRGGTVILIPDHNSVRSEFKR